MGPPLSFLCFSGTRSAVRLLSLRQGFVNLLQWGVLISGTTGLSLKGGPALYPLSIVLSLLVPLVCVIALWQSWVGHHRLGASVMSIAHALCMGSYGVSHADAGAVSLPCLPAALLLFSSIAAAGSAQAMALPLLCAIIVPAAAFPGLFLDPLAAWITASALVLTILSLFTHVSEDNIVMPCATQISDLTQGSVTWKASKEMTFSGVIPDVSLPAQILPPPVDCIQEIKIAHRASAESLCVAPSPERGGAAVAVVSASCPGCPPGECDGSPSSPHSSTDAERDSLSQPGSMRAQSVRSFPGSIRDFAALRRSSRWKGKARNPVLYVDSAVDVEGSFPVQRDSVSNPLETIGRHSFDAVPGDTAAPSILSSDESRLPSSCHSVAIPLQGGCTSPETPREEVHEVGPRQLARIRAELAIQQNQFRNAKREYDSMLGKYRRGEEDLNHTMGQIKVLRWILPPQPEAIPESSPLSPGVTSSFWSPESSGCQMSEADSLFAHFSHDLRTPLTTAISVLQILSDGPVQLQDAEQKDLVKKAWSSLQYALLLINNVLDYSKMQCVGLAPARSRVSVRQLASEVLRNLEVQASHEKTELVMDAHNNIPSLLVTDRMMLQRVMMNLVSNALKFTSGGRVLLKLFWEAAQARLHVSVQDTGSGMTPDELNKIFQQFYQTGHDKGGTGLGLSICRRLVTALGGSVEASSGGKGQGSVFKFDIHAPVAGNATSWVDCSAFVVDSDVARAEALCHLLTHIGVCILDSTVEHDEAPKICFVCTQHPTWETEAMLWRTRGSAVCAVVPNTVSVRPPVDVVQAVLRSPFDANELREVVGTLSGLPASESFSSSDRVADSSEKLTSEALSTTEPRVLLAEDNKINHKLFLRHLAQVGLMCTDSAFSGKEALELASQIRYSVILLDLEMPEMGGLEASQRIREHPVNRDTPIVALTAAEGSELRSMCMEAGMTAFVAKPLSAQDWRSIAAIAAGRGSA